MKNVNKAEKESLWSLPSSKEMSLMYYKAFIDADREEKAIKRVAAKASKGVKKSSMTSKTITVSSIKHSETVSPKPLPELKENSMERQKELAPLKSKKGGK